MPALLVVAALEVPWAIYLTVTQSDEAKAGYLRWAAAGLALGAWATAGMAAAGLLRRREWAAVPAVMGATLWLGMGVNGVIAAPVGSARDFPALSIPLGLSIPATIASGAVAAGVLSGRLSGRAAWLAAAALLVFPALLTYVALTAPHMPNRTRVPNGAVSWDVLDAAEIALLVITGLALWRRQARTTLVAASAGLMLFTGDAFFNVVLTKGEAFEESLVFLFIGELPTAILCLISIRSALRLLNQPDTGPDLPTKGHIA